MGEAESGKLKAESKKHLKKGHMPLIGTLPFYRSLRQKAESTKQNSLLNNFLSFVLGV
jgi:hypothetical protein